MDRSFGEGRRHQGCLCTERSAEDGYAVALGSQQVEGTQKGLDGDVERPWLLLGATEPAHRQGERAVPREKPRPGVRQ